MPNLKSISIIYIAVLMTFLAVSQKSHAFEPEFYSESSLLSQGNWAKIEVKETGMQFLSDAVIRSLGFSDPEKVNIFGYGGVMVPENLQSPDDLPIVTSLRVNGGLVFFGRNHIGWTANPTGSTVYSHISHPYSDNSYYFISDCLPERALPDKAEVVTAISEPIKIFTERLLHEQELSMPMNSGRLVLGEDFKTQTTRTFQFDLAGNTGNASVKTAFGSKTNGGTSTLVMTANGKQLAATNNDRMVDNASKLIVTTTSVKNVEDPGSKLDFTVKFNGSGTVNTAALDYIEVEYPRQLAISDGQLYFYLSPRRPSIVHISGASPNIRLWEVTDPSRHVELEYTLDGNTLIFNTEPGYHEYVAFDPTLIKREVAAAGKVVNQDIHSMASPDMLLISPPEYKSAAQRIVKLHQKTDGLKVLVLTPEEIYNEFSSGKPDVTAFRKLLKMWYDRAWGREGEYASYCLILSRPTYDNKMITSVVKNAGYPRVPIWQSATGETETTSYSTDDYIGMLEDPEENFSLSGAQINVAVGRMPVKSLNEANTVIDKLEDYLLNPDLGAWRNNVMIIADDQDNGVHIEQAEKVVNELQSNEKGKSFLYEKLYLDAYKMEYSGVGASYPQAKERMMNKWNEGTAYIDYIGHANPKSWGHEYMLTWPDIISMSNSRLPFIYAATCEFLRWDSDDISGGEILWSLPNSGVIGMICPSREVLISANGVLNASIAKYIFATDDEGNPLRVGDAMRLGKNASNTGSNKLRYGIIGDPAMRLPWPDLMVNVDQINGIDLSEAEDYPVLQARSSVTLSGHVADYKGNLIEDFNGIAEIALYDAERVITTNANGSDGVVSEYNDRKTRLFVGRTKVEDGKWSTTFTMPSEIENNYSPALLSLYASDEKNREANGWSEKLYAYGYDVTAPEDYEGPKLLEFYLNTPAFVSGSMISPSPVLKAVFYDESGISVSEAGIGHNITLELDGKKFYDDVAQYYIPDENESGKGSLTYSLGEIEQGDHTLTFTVWDNANNSTRASLKFSISALWKPTIEMLTTDVNPASSEVNFIVITDGASGTMECGIDVYDIWGKRVWYGAAPSLSGHNNRTTLNWNLCDFGGGKVQPGIYLYRATVKMENGATIAKTKKLIVR